MRQRDLGRGLRVSAVGLGTMGMTMAYGQSDDARSIATIQRAYETGVTLFDTAEMYNASVPGSNERLLGRAVRGFRDEVTLATKFGYDIDADQTAAPVLDSRPERIRAVVDNSLRYLGTDRIDVLYQHRVDPDVPIEEVAGAVAELAAEGKVLHFGLSEASPGIIRRAHAVHPVTVLQSEYSMFEREVEAVLPTIRELGIGLVAYAPLGRGFLTETVKPSKEYEVDDMRRFDPRWQPENFERNVAAVRELRHIAQLAGVSLPQLALAWVLHEGSDIVPVFGTRTPERIDENAAAVDAAIAPELLERVRELLPDGAFDSRYTDGHMPTSVNVWS
ncbi:aryl-alcohol dehydrogenase-like predicted oxidoreductase [Microbacterium halimionae]|uniref:Aryl-alcohol dehydrogenase-like predicted oxidoreductase n=1 Tax=Microbacterium halimionae TaxID=1526413 RepID=A0A7W3PKJ3_9MICO|nr:aldo/keto reductase [Microbacterium halimionae]MBA8815565.1 aryl-alcohol dehydrogenase-like predicted oxidoreductase [Microbacterium halimionae]NII95611.1 aryl-alcohol dehydrogenase-like predicted oxidoreductase [Microbacterium halimionae]